MGNNYTKEGKNFLFAYDEDSIIEKIAEKAGGAKVYWAKMRGDGINFNLFNLNDQKTFATYSNNTELTEDYITDISKHVIIVFEAAEPEESNDSVYSEFNYMLSQIVYDVSVLNGGILPKVNLIGHSRGGLTNLQYALDHPDLVDSLISIGTPYFSTTTGKLSQIVDSRAGIESIVTPEIYGSYNKRWNDNYDRLYKNINAVAIGGYSSLSFLGECVWHDPTGNINEELAAAIDALLAGIASAKFSTAWNKPLETLTATLIAETLELLMPSTYVTSLAHIILSEINLDRRPPFISWYNDICVDLNSQLALRTIDTDGVYSYKGFKRKTRFFNNLDGTDFEKLSFECPAIPHNLEPRDAKIIKWAVNELDIGEGGQSGFEYTQKEDGTLRIDGFNGTFNETVFPIPSSLNGRTINEIASYAFDSILDEFNVTTLNIPASVKEIGAGAFCNNKLLTTVNLQGTSLLESIGSGAFANCEALNSFVIPEKVAHVGDCAFLGCKEISSYVLSTSNTSLTVQNGVLYNKDETMLISYPTGKADTTFTVPSGITEIWYMAFFGNENLTSINLNDVTFLREYAFMNCSNLATITGNKITTILQDALSGTKWLADKLKCSNDYVSLGKSLYYYKGNQADVDLSDYSNIGANAFVSNKSLQSVTFGNNMSLIDKYAFYDCTNLENVYLNNLHRAVFIREGVFEKNNENRKLYIPKHLQSQYAKTSNWDRYTLSVHETTVNYNLNGGTIDGGSNYTGTFIYGDNINLLTPERQGYTFDGWYGDFDGTEVTGEEIRQGTLWTSYDETTDLYAKWVPIIYTLTLHADNAVSERFEYSVNEAKTLPTPVLSGYDFDGWFTTADYSGQKYTTTEGLCGSIILYAKWNTSTYTVTYNLNDDEDTPATIGNSSTVVAYGELFTLDVPTRAHYIFKGWKDSLDNQTALLTNEQGVGLDRWVVRSDATVYAHWERPQCQIKLISSYGINEINVEVLYSTSAILPLPGDVPGRRFNGWFTSKNIQVTDSVGAMSQLWETTENTILYAHWVSVQYSITYVLNGGTNSGSNKPIFTVDDIGITLNEAIRNGYRFKGWYSDASFINAITKIETIGNKIYYAKWAKLYTITFNAGKGTSCATIYGIKDEEITLPESIYGGYKGGWQYSNGATLETYAFGCKYVIGTANVTLTASWTEKSVTECYNSKSGIYEIWTYNQFKNIKQICIVQHRSIWIMADLEIPFGQEWTGICDNYAYINFNYHTIKNLNFHIGKVNYSNETYAGLFARNYGTITKLSLIGVNIKYEEYHGGSNVYVGAVAGCNSGNIEECFVQGNIEVNRMNSAVGGICGKNISQIQNCQAGGVRNKYNSSDNNNYTLTMFANGDVGGITGYNTNYVFDCRVKNAEIELYVYKNNKSAGGVVGWTQQFSSTIGCSVENITVAYIGKWNITNNNLHPNIGYIVGGLDRSTINNCTATNSQLLANSLPEGSKKNFGKHEYQCIGQIYGTCIINGETVQGSTTY